jgi:hypothetical protein
MASRQVRPAFSAASFADGFALVVSVPELPVTPLRDECPSEGFRRARRFAILLPLRYRLPDHDEWQRGVTENVSHSGLLFSLSGTTSAFSAKETPVEIVLEVPDGEASRPVEVRCSGKVVRLTELRPGRQALAVAVRGYAMQ